ncbi:MerR family transcriptional regulator [bacterium]|nr:MerR family transcriptional regulator [bacterium]
MKRIPDKLYFKIGEVAQIAGVEPFVLRFWQKEFKELRPRQNNKGQRRYTRTDVELVLTIAHLRYQQKYTIEGIKKLFAEKEKKSTLVRKIATHQHQAQALCQQVKQDVEDILEILSGTPDQSPSNKAGRQS